MDILKRVEITTLILGIYFKNIKGVSMPVIINDEEVQFFSECNTHSPFPLASSNARKGHPKVDLIYPEVLFPSNQIFKRVGEEKIRELVYLQHVLLRKSKIGNLYPQDDKEFDSAMKIIEDFFVQMLGGEDIYTSKQGHPRLRDRHFPFEVNEEGRDIWLACCKKALKDLDFPKDLLPEFWNWVESLSIRMVNRRTTMCAMKRYPFETISSYFDK